MQIHRSPRHGAARWRPGTFARVRALLAGALVLGVGATATLAAWTDQEFATAQVTAGEFELESRTVEAAGAWANHSGTAAPLSLDDATAWYPDQARAAWFQIRTAAGSVPGSVSLTGVALAYPPGGPAANDTALAGALSVRMAPVAGPSACTTAIGGAPTAIDTAPPGIGPYALDANGGNVVTICVVVMLPTDASASAQGGSVVPTWEFTGTTPTA